MKRVLVALCLALYSALSVGAEVTLSTGGVLNVDSSAAELFDPQIDATALGDHSWVPTDKIGFLADWSGSGSYRPISGRATGFFLASLHASYMAGKFLSRLSLSGLADLSTEEPFYGAASSELLFSYGGPAFSLFGAPRLSLVEDSGTTALAGARIGSAILLADSFLMEPVFEAGLSLPGGAYSTWYINPSFAVDRYAGGPITVGFAAGYKKSSSSRQSALVAGGPLLPLDTWDRFSLSGNLLWLIGRGATFAAELPVEYTLKSYDAFDGAVDLGVRAWTVGLGPGVELTMAMSSIVDLVFSADTLFVLSNNAVERQVAVSAGVHLEVHPE